MRRWIAWGCLVFASCARPQTGSADPRIGDDHPLHGAWTTLRAPDGDILPCPLVVELFADGTAEINFASDDSPAEMCQFFRVPWQHDETVEPKRIRLAGQLMSCIYRREGPALRLACEDRSEPPDDFELSLLLHRFAVREGAGLADLAGRWSAVSFWGSDTQHIDILPNGEIHVGETTGRIEVLDRRRLTMQGASSSERQNCLYRVTEHRLTLRCEHSSRAFPDSFGGPGAGVGTLVLSRKSPDADTRPLN